MNYLIPLHWNHPIQCAIITSSFFVWTPALLFHVIKTLSTKECNIIFASPMLLGYRMGVSCNSLFQSRNSYETDYTRALTILQAWYQFAASGFDFPHSNG